MPAERKVAATEPVVRRAGVLSFGGLLPMADGESGSVSVLLADVHPVVLKGMEKLLTGVPGIELVGTCIDGAEALGLIAARAPQVAFLDVRMPRVSGIEVLRAVRALGVPTRVVLHITSISGTEVREAVSLGVDGLILKDAVLDELLRCMRSLAAGGRWLPPSLSSAVAASDFARPLVRKALLETLTVREQEISVLVGKGLPNKAIAQQLGVTGGTVKVHLYNIYKKLGLTNRASLAAHAALKAAPQRPVGKNGAWSSRSARA